MSWIRQHRRSSILIGLTLLLPVYFYLSTLAGLLGLGFEYASERSQLEPRLARVAGLLDHEEELREQSALAAERLRDLVHPPTADPSALAASLQADARQILAEAGLSVSNSQVMPLREGERFDQVAVKLTVSGSLAALDAALAGIAASRPQLIVESIDAFPARAMGTRGGDELQSLTAVMQLMVLRALP